jgi:3-oxoacyl-[acyl-carrier protein] reductase
MLTSLQQKSVIVTGGTKGIGQGIAKVFVERGANVCIIGRNKTDGHAVVKTLSANGGNIFFCPADVKDQASLEQAIATVVSKFGGVDILCANAGMFPQATLDEMDRHTWDDMMDTNLTSLFCSVKVCLPHLKQSQAGRIVLTSSITGPITGYPGFTHYGASKAGMLGFMRSAALELAPHQITINAVMPGNVLTESLAALGPEYIEATAANIPLQRLGSVEDIGNAVAFLASAEAGFITGQSIVVDGGQTLPESPL